MPPILFPLIGPLLGGGGMGVPAVLFGRLPPPPTPGRTIVGVSRDGEGLFGVVGAPLGGCTCTLFRVDTTGAAPSYTQIATTISDGSGNYSFLVGFDGPYRVTFDLDGSPDVAGATVNTLVGT